MDVGTITRDVKVNKIMLSPCPNICWECCNELISNLKFGTKIKENI